MISNDAHLRREGLALYCMSISVWNHRSGDGYLLNPNLIPFLAADNFCEDSGLLLLNLFPNPLRLSPEADWVEPSKTTRSPISFIAKLRRPRPSPSPKGSPESSKSELNDSICGATNSFNMGKVEPPLGGFLKADSRARVLKVCLEQSGILTGQMMAESHSHRLRMTGLVSTKKRLHNLRVPSKTRSAFEAPTK